MAFLCKAFLWLAFLLLLQTICTLCTFGRAPFCILIARRPGEALVTTAFKTS